MSHRHVGSYSFLGCLRAKNATRRLAASPLQRGFWLKMPEIGAELRLQHARGEGELRASQVCTARAAWQATQLYCWQRTTDAKVTSSFEFVVLEVDGARGH